VTRILLALALVVLPLPALAQAERGPDNAEWRGRWHRGGHDGVHLRVLRSYELPQGTTVREPIVVLGGSATIDGRAEDDVVVIGGTLRVGPTGVVLGDVVTVGGMAQIDPAATIQGRVENTSVAGPNVDFGWGWQPWHLTRGFWAAAALSATLLRLGLTLVVALLVAAAAPGWLRTVAGRTTAAPGTVAAVGFVGELLIVPAILMVVIALVLSVIGIPLLLVLPFAIAGAAVVWTAGLAAVSALVGARLRGVRAGQPPRPLLDITVGLVALSLLTIFAHVVAFGPVWLTPVSAALGVTGLLVEYAAWTVGLGAVLLTLWNGGPQTAPPPVPAPSPAL
jgi:hypothetical protein